MSINYAEVIKKSGLQPGQVKIFEETNEKHRRLLLQLWGLDPDSQDEAQAESQNPPGEEAQTLAPPDKNKEQAPNSKNLSPQEKLQKLYELFGQRVVLILARGTKEPVDKGWREITFEQTQDPAYQNRIYQCFKEGGNLGLAMGELSGNLIGIDIDTDKSVEPMLALNPKLQDTIRRNGAKGCQFYPEIFGDYPKAIIPLYFNGDGPKKERKWGEWRGIGNCAIYGQHPDSTPDHPIHFKIVSGAKKPIQIRFDEIVWPEEIERPLPWEKPPPRKEPDPPPRTDSRLKAAVAKLTVAYLWNYFGCPPRNGKNPVCSPFREDKHPSFSIFNDGTGFYDHGYPEHRGDGYNFFQLHHKLDSKTAYEPFLRLAGLWDEPRAKEATADRAAHFTGEQEPEMQDRQPRKLCGASILVYAQRTIDSSKNLLGNRWLSRCCGAFIVAPSGHGKSSLVIQAAICWSCGRVAFGIRPVGPLRILIVQSEDDDNDIIEMAQMCERLELSEDEKKLVGANTHVEWLNDVSGANFFPVLEDFLGQFRADLVVINPYSAYQGGDLRDDKLNNDFLRGQLNRVMRLYDCGALPIHHTPKTNFQNVDQYSWFDWMYAMAGGAALTNWARGIMVMAPSDTPGTYRFIAAKRFEKIGWQSREYWFAHSVKEGKILWVPASVDQIASGSKGRTAGREALLSIVPKIDPVRIENLIIASKEKFGFGEKKVRTFLKVLLDEQKVFAHQFPRPRTNSETRYAQTKPTNMDD